MIRDLPKSMSHDSNIVHCADDIAIWMNVSLRKRTSRRFVNYVRKLDLKEIDKLSAYMKVSGLEFLSEKTNMILFNNSSGPKELI